MAVSARTALALLALLVTAGSCRTVDQALLGLRSVAGGIHNRRRAVGAQPFFLADGRLGLAANGALWLEARAPRAPGTAREARGWRAVTPQAWEIADPVPLSPTPGGGSAPLAFVSGREQITAGGGHNDHVWQLYRLDLDGDATSWRRLSQSRRAEHGPARLRSGPGAQGRDTLLVWRRDEYDAWALEGGAWGRSALFEVDPERGWAARLTPPLAWPIEGTACGPAGAWVLFAASGSLGPALEAPAQSDAGPTLWRLELAGARDARALEPLLSNARLPVVFDGGEQLAFVRSTAEGCDVWLQALDRNGRPSAGARPLGLAAAPIRAFAISPDGTRLVYTEERADEGRRGRLVVRECALSAGAQVSTLARLDVRDARRHKPLDVVKPFRWWFRPDASPGSR